MCLKYRLCCTEKRRAARFSVIHLLAYLFNALHSEHSADFCTDIAEEYLFERGFHKLAHTLNRLEIDIAGKAVGHYNVNLAECGISRFDISGKVERAVFEQLVSLLLKLSALFLFCADIEKTYLGVLHTHYLVHINTAHNSKLP